MDRAHETLPPAAGFVDETRRDGGAGLRAAERPPEHPRTRPVVDPHAEGSAIEPPAVPDGTFVKVALAEHPLPRACEVCVYFQDYHRSSSKLGRFAKIVGIDEQGGEYLLMLDNFECVAVPMRRVEWRKVAT